MNLTNEMIEMVKDSDKKCIIYNNEYVLFEKIEY